MAKAVLGGPAVTAYIKEFKGSIFHVYFFPFGGSAYQITYNIEISSSDMFCYFQPKSLSSLRFRPHVPFSTRALLFRFLICSTVVRAAINITVDDGDPGIIYSPGGAWKRSAPSPLNYGGSHMFSMDAGATAVFSFTGEHENFALTRDS